jgi:hypothetical protein
VFDLYLKGDLKIFCGDKISQYEGDVLLLCRRFLSVARLERVLLLLCRHFSPVAIKKIACTISCADAFLLWRDWRELF